MTAQFKDMGTTMSASMQSQMGDSPVKNWKGVGYLDFPFRSKAAKISDVNYKEFWTKKYACANCVLGCSAVLNVTKGKYKIGETHRPEYETIASFGSILLNNDIETLLYANEICNSQGFDTISAGSTIAFAMECFEHNILTLKETDGIDLTWGNSEGIIKVLEKMVHRDGIGDLLADGAKVAADKLGKGAEEYAMHVHGQDIAMHDPRLNIGFASTYVADPTPGKHTPGGTGIPETGLPLIFPEKGEIPPLPNDSYEEKGRYQKILSIAMLLLNMVGICGFSGWPGIRMPISEYINAITGWELSFEDTSLSGETIMNLRQAFNVREGIKPSDFKLPKRVLGLPPLENGPTKNVTVDVDTLVNDYFQNMDWDMNTGKPSKEKLKELGLDMVIKDLY